MAWIGVITNQGEKLLSEWTDGAVCQIVSAYIGSGTVKEAVMLAQTDVAGTKRKAGIVAHKTVNKGKKVSVQVQAGETGYRLRQIGLWAALDSADAVMIALFQNEDGVQIPTQVESPDFVYNFHAVLSVSVQGELAIEVDPSALVSQGSMRAAIAAACEEKQDKLTGLPGQIVRFDENGKAMAQEGDYLPLSGGELTGALSVPQNGGLIVKGPEATMLGDEDIRIEHEADMDASLPEVKFVQYLDGVRAPDNKVCLTGLDIPHTADGAATKGYVDDTVAGAGGPYYATCATSASTAEKTASCEGFTLKTGAAVAVKFANANSVPSPTLNVNGTGAKSIKAYGTMGVITGGMAGLWEAGSIVPFVYDGTNWVMANGCLAQRLRYLQNTALILGADGSMPGPVLACPDSNHGAAQLRNIYFTTTDLTAGTSYLDSGAIAIVYEE